MVKYISEVFMVLREYLKQLGSAAIAFSGGVDSAYLLCEAVRSGIKVRAYYVKSDFQPQFELEDAKRLAEELGADMKVLELDALKDPRVAANPSERCYFCKQNIFTNIIEAAKADGFTNLLDGTNASDDAGDRPGMRALRELNVKSPLRDCGLTKDEIRRLSKEAGLFTWNKPAYACLATRIPTGCEITKEILKTTEKAEEMLMAMGFSDFRIRYMGGAARIQLKEEQISLLTEKRSEITEALKPLYSAVLFDLEVR